MRTPTFTTKLSSYIIPGTESVIRNAQIASCFATGLPYSRITENSRKGKVPITRFIAARLLLDYSNISKSEIGRRFNLSHCAIIYGIKSIDTAIDLHSMGIRSEIYNYYHVADNYMMNIYKFKTNRELIEN